MTNIDEQYHSLIDAIPALVAVLDATGRSLYRNRSFYEYSGFTEEQSRDWWNEGLILREDVISVAAEWQKTTSAGLPAQAEMRIRRSDGTYRWHIVRAAPVPSLAKWLLIATDIHDRRIAEGELRRITADLRAANAVKDEFLGMVSHELKTPITTILGTADVLTKHGERIDAADRDASLGDIKESATRLNQLIDNLLLLSRLEVGQRIEAEPIPVRHEIDKIVAGYQTRETDRVFNVRIDPSTPPVSAEPTNFRQVLENLLSNAIKYSPARTAIDIVTQCQGSDLVISVLDRGSGIAAEEAESLFEPFYRSDRTSHAASGAGVGLTVCRRLIEAQGGRIWAAPRDGGGSIFSISLPMEEGDEALER